MSGISIEIATVGEATEEGEGGARGETSMPTITEAPFAGN